jgi:hypothetical protein
MALASMEPRCLVCETRAHALLVFCKDGKLILRGPKNSDSELAQTLLRRKAILLPLLEHWDESAWERFDERVSIAMADGGLSLLAAEQLALDEIQSTQTLM